MFSRVNLKLVKTSVPREVLDFLIHGKEILQTMHFYRKLNILDLNANWNCNLAYKFSNWLVSSHKIDFVDISRSQYLWQWNNGQTNLLHLTSGILVAQPTPINPLKHPLLLLLLRTFAHFFGSEGAQLFIGSETIPNTNKYYILLIT